ncbi:GntR family transcriptional regulator [Escherichia coli]
MHLSTHPTSYPTRYQEIAAKLEQELRQHYRCGDYLPAEQQLAARFRGKSPHPAPRHRPTGGKRLGTAPSGRRRTGADAPVRLPAQRPGAF